jgi:dynein heavy chain
MQHQLLVVLNPLGDSSACRFSEWPADALKSVASRFLHDVDMETQDTRNAVEDMCMVFHQTVSRLHGVVCTRVSARGYCRW